MSESSPITNERARKNSSIIFRQFASLGQEHVAKALNTSAATVSRWQANEVERCAGILASLGLKIVPETMRCFDPQKIGAILHLAKAHLADVDNAEELQWEE